MIPRRSTRGFTLIETIMTIVLLSVGAVFITSSFSTLLTNAHRGQEQLQALYLAEEWAAEAEAAGYGNATGEPATAVPNFPGFTRSRTTPVPGANCPAGVPCQQTTVTVSLNNAVIARRTVTIYPPIP